MRLAVLTATITLAICAQAAAFNPYTGLQPADSYAQLGGALQIARAAWPGSPCLGREWVAFKAPDLPDGQLSLEGDTGVGYALPQGCRVYLSTTPLTGYQLCVLLTHELGHLAGYTHADAGRLPVMAHDIPGWAPCEGVA